MQSSYAVTGHVAVCNIYLFLSYQKGVCQFFNQNYIKHLSLFISYGSRKAQMFAGIINVTYSTKFPILTSPQL